MRRVLMLHAGALGDCILALQIAAAVRRRFDGVTLDLVARSEAGPMAANWGLIDTSFSPEQFGLHRLFGDDALPKTLVERLDGYDGVVNLLGGLDEAVSERLRQACAGAVFCVAPAPAPARGGMHIVDQWLATLASQKLKLKSSEQALHTPDDQERLAGRVLLKQVAGQLVGRVMVCHPGSGGRAKCCPLDVLEQAINRQQEAGHTAFWMVGPTELDWHGADYVRRLARSAPVLQDLSVSQAAGVLAGADVFVGNDAGMTHLAASLGLPTVALFGPTDSAVWRPWGPRVRVLNFARTAADKLIEEIAQTTRR